MLVKLPLRKLLIKSSSLILLFLTVSLYAQHTVSGTFSPAKDFSWLLVYKLNPIGETYILGAPIKNGAFSFVLPKAQSKGTYRIVYAVPQDEFNFDFLYNAEEDITLAFDKNVGVRFINSQENILFQTYRKEISDIEQEISTYYASGKTDKARFLQLSTQLEKVQQTYEEKAKGKLAYDFIAANAPFIPKKEQSIESYLKNKKENYLSKVDFDNKTLQGSNFLIEKVLSYSYTSSDLLPNSKSTKQEEIKKNITEISKKLVGIDQNFQMRVYLNLWNYGVSLWEDEVADYIYTTHLKRLAVSTGNEQIVDAIELHNRLRLGAVAPDISWKENNNTQQLRKLTHKGNYVLVFWSSTCSHCLAELPKLHSALKADSNTKVIAIGLEDDTENWKKEAAKLDLFAHAIALGKWESEYARLYAIQQTPTYFILDSEKRIMAKPEDYEKVLEILKQ